MTKKSIAQLIIIGVMPLFLLLSGPVNAADKAADAKMNNPTLDAASEGAQKNPKAFEQGSGPIPSGPDTTPEMKQQQPHDVDNATITGSTKEEALGKTKDEAPKELTEAQKEAEKEKIDNAYQAGIDNCDQFSGGAKNECIAKVRTKYAR